MGSNTSHLSFPPFAPIHASTPVMVFLPVRLTSHILEVTKSAIGCIARSIVTVRGKEGRTTHESPKKRLERFAHSVIQVLSIWIFE
jgi:hypothetical protein